MFVDRDTNGIVFADPIRPDDRVYAELTETKESYTAYERQDIQMKENIKFEKGNIKKLEGKVTAEQSKMEDAQTALDEAEESIPTLEELIEE